MTTSPPMFNMESVCFNSEQLQDYLELLTEKNKHVIKNENMHTVII